MRCSAHFDSCSLQRVTCCDDTERMPLKLEPPHAPRDEAIFWLTAAAEIEHFLMVQYLFAAYSLNLRDAGDQKEAVGKLQNTVLQIAREEMGHLITVQNLLHVLGAPLNFRREHSSYASEIYPFRFKLEPMSQGSLAKYTLAESPEDRKVLKAGLKPKELKIYDGPVCKLGHASNDSRKIRHVGPIFERLRELFADKLEDTDFRLDRAGYQARWSDWGYEPHPDATDIELRVLVRTLDQTNATDLRKAAVQAIKDIGEQGERADMEMLDGESHFERFFAGFKAFRDIEKALGRPPTWPVADNPNASVAPQEGERDHRMLDTMLDSPFSRGRISNERSRKWAQLFNLRYRLLLSYLHHALLLDGGPFKDNGDRTDKGIVMYWTFCEMRRVKKLAHKLVQMPLDDGTSGRNAGPPFELPYSLNHSMIDRDRWATHADVLGASIMLIGELLADDDDKDDPFLKHLRDDDTSTQAVARSIADGMGVPQEIHPTDFRKTVHILDEAVRGFEIRAHKGFWQDKTRKKFVDTPVFGSLPIVPKDADASLLFSLISLPNPASGRMPRYRPAIPQSRIEFIREWIDDEAPDNEPPGQIGIASKPPPKDEPASPAPQLAAQAQLSFAQDIKPLFREFPDRASMLFLFDLHDYDDVRANADGILDSVKTGRMPCTGRWPQEDVQKFEAWINAGFPQ